MKLYAGIDLHSNNSVVTVIDEQDRVVAEKRLPNELERIVLMLAAFRDALAGIVVESTFNCYWLVDGLMQAGFQVHLANTAAIQQYEGIKYTDDQHDARWLAHLLRLGILREGYVYPRESRGVRDLMRRRMQLVQSRTTQLLAIQTQLERSTGRGMNAEAIKRAQPHELAGLVHDANVGSALCANLAVVQVLTEQIERLEREILGQVRLAAQFAPLLSIPGIGKILGLAIMLETGEIGRFAKRATSPPTRAACRPSASPTGRRRAKATPSAATPTWPGPSWRRPTLRCATTRASGASTSARLRAPTRSWPSRRWRTSWRARPTGSCAIRCPSMRRAPLPEN